MTFTAASVRISEGGRIVIPASIRKALGLRVGDTVVLELEADQVRLISIRQAIREAQAGFAKYLAGKPSMVDELLAERKAEAALD